MVATDTAAGRLYGVLESLIANASGSLFSTWSRALIKHDEDEEDGPTPIRVMGRLVDVMGLPAQVRAEVTTHLPDQAAFLLRYMPRVEQALALTNFDDNTNAVRTMIDEPTLYSIEAIAHMLPSPAREPRVSEENRTQLQEQLADLGLDVRSASDLDDGLRLLLLTHIRAMQEALDRVVYLGVEPIRDEIDRTIGELVRRPDLREEVKESTLGQRFLSVVASLTVLVGFGHQTLELVAGVQDQIGAGDESAQVIEVRIDDTDSGVGEETRSPQEEER
jgi:hypothetical protein